jgi:CheY-like chemotaxis protein
VRKWDVFISHASEDKAEVARPLRDLLTEAGLRVWLDEDQLRLGDSLRAKINKGIAASRYGVVILSPSFFAKQWPQAELDGLANLESRRRKVILPIWHQVDHAMVKRRSPLLADRLALDTKSGLPNVAAAIIKVTGRPAEPSRSRTQVGTIRVLIVDIEAKHRSALAAMMGAWGMHAEGAADGIEALETLRDREFDVITVELNLPRMDGFELMRKLRAIPHAPPVIALTAFGSIESALKCMHELGAFWFLEKPIEPKALRAIIDRAAASGRRAV